MTAARGAPRHVSFLLWLALAELLAAQSLQAADAQRGRTLAQTCLACHSQPAMSVSDSPDQPPYRVPLLQGQQSGYLLSALRQYRDGSRSSAIMQPFAQSLSESDLADVAAFLAGSTLQSRADGPTTAPEGAGRVCGSCHGLDGVGRLPESPSLAGQANDYLLKTMIDYKQHLRPHRDMASFMEKVDAAEMQIIADYYSSLPGLRPVAQ